MYKSIIKLCITVFTSCDCKTCHKSGIITKTRGEFSSYDLVSDGVFCLSLRIALVFPFVDIVERKTYESRKDNQTSRQDKCDVVVFSYIQYKPCKIKLTVTYQGNIFD